ncbi:MAG: hypothetical protein AAGJ11_15085, partial [Bacteroidota bacterium]
RLVLVWLLALGATALAQPAPSSPAAPVAQELRIDGSALPAAVRTAARPVSPEVAAVLSAAATGGTVGVGYLLDRRASGGGFGAVVILGGLLVAPSVGNLVQRNDRDALIGFGVRTLGLSLAAGGVVSSFMNDSAGTIHAVVIGGGFVLGASGIIYDIVSAGRYDGRVVAAPVIDRQTGALLAGVRVSL